MKKKRPFHQYVLAWFLALVLGTTLWTAAFFTFEGQMIPSDLLQSRVLRMTYFRSAPPITQNFNTYFTAPTPSQTRIFDCTDSDGGTQPFKKGEVKSSFGTYTDICQNPRVLQEFFCTSEGRAGFESVECISGCRLGQCAPEPAKPKELILTSPIVARNQESPVLTSGEFSRGQTILTFTVKNPSAENLYRWMGLYFVNDVSGDLLPDVPLWENFVTFSLYNDTNEIARAKMRQGRLYIPFQSGYIPLYPKEEKTYTLRIFIDRWHDRFIDQTLQLRADTLQGVQGVIAARDGISRPSIQNAEVRLMTPLFVFDSVENQYTKKRIQEQLEAEKKANEQVGLSLSIPQKSEGKTLVRSDREVPILRLRLTGKDRDIVVRRMVFRDVFGRDRLRLGATLRLQSSVSSGRQKPLVLSQGEYLSGYLVFNFPADFILRKNESRDISIVMDHIENVDRRYAGEGFQLSLATDRPQKGFELLDVSSFKKIEDPFVRETDPIVSEVFYFYAR